MKKFKKVILFLLAWLPVVVRILFAGIAGVSALLVIGFLMPEIFKILASIGIVNIMQFVGFCFLVLLGFIVLILLSIGGIYYTEWAEDYREV